MGFRFERIRPREVDAAIKAGDHEKVLAFAKAGGKAAAQVKAEQKRIADEKEAKQLQEEAIERAAKDEVFDDILRRDAFRNAMELQVPEDD